MCQLTVICTSMEDQSKDKEQDGLKISRNKPNAVKISNMTSDSVTGFQQAAKTINRMDSTVLQISAFVTNLLQHLTVNHCRL